MARIEFTSFFVDLELRTSFWRQPSLGDEYPWVQTAEAPIVSGTLGMPAGP
jgi:hypothetical protein